MFSWVPIVLSDLFIIALFVDTHGLGGAVFSAASTL